jgi:hypothetical protein
LMLYPWVEISLYLNCYCEEDLNVDPFIDKLRDVHFPKVGARF